MPSEFQTHRLARSEVRYVEGYGHTQIEMGRKYIALCGYIGYSRNSFVGSHRGVTCKRCLKKMQANKGLQSDPPSACPSCGVVPGRVEHDRDCPLVSAGS